MFLGIFFLSQIIISFPLNPYLGFRTTFSVFNLGKMVFNSFLLLTRNSLILVFLGKREYKDRAYGDRPRYHPL